MKLDGGELSSSWKARALVAPASPSSPLKGVVQRGTTRVWECEARVVQQPMAEEDDFMLSPEKAQVLVQ